MGWSKILSLAFICLVSSLVLPCFAQNDLSDEMVKEYLDAHNEARGEVNVEPLTWDTKVAAYAQQYANKRIEDCELVHSEGPYGENLSWRSGNELPPKDAVKMWVDEKAFYNVEDNTCEPNKVCGHYTQVVWRNSLRVGCAKVICDNNGGTLVTCNYDPPGNYQDEKPF